MQPTSIRIPPEVLRELDALAARRNRSRTGQLLWMIRQAVIADGRPDPLEHSTEPDDDGPGGASAMSPEPCPRRSGETPIPSPNRAEAA